VTVLSYGLREIPEGIECAWGARWIWPNDLVWNRQDTTPHAPAPQHDVARLHEWLNAGALASAMDEAKRLADSYELTGSENRTVTLHEDERGIVRANPQRSFGYLYVAAWLK
jgi:hypothetical protein